MIGLLRFQHAYIQQPLILITIHTARPSDPIQTGTLEHCLGSSILADICVQGRNFESQTAQLPTAQAQQQTAAKQNTRSPRQTLPCQYDAGTISVQHSQLAHAGMNCQPRARILQISSDQMRNMVVQK